MTVWAVTGSYGLWIVRAATEQEAIDIAFAGPDLGRGPGPADNYDVAREVLEALRLDDDGPTGIIEGRFG